MDTPSLQTPLYCIKVSSSENPRCITGQDTISGALGAVLLWLVWSFASTTIRNRKYKMPPRVPGLPFIGNTLQLPPEHQGPLTAKLAKKYGEMFTMKIGGLDWVFLNSSRVVSDLLERRSGIYCSRPPFPMTQDIMSRGGRVVLMGYSDLWKSVRKSMHLILSSRQLDAFRPFQDLESRHLLYDYLHKPDRWYEANGRFSNSVIMSVVFGRRSDMDNPQLKDLQDTIEMFLRNQQPGVNLVDVWPALARLPKPLQWWRRRGEKMFEETKRVYELELRSVRERIADGTQRPCFASDLLKSNELERWGETQTLFVLGTLLEAGTDTTRISIAQALAAAAVYPDWVSRAREQLDAVCGHNAERLPGFDDRSQLPYMTAVVKEIFRWRPIIAEIGVPTSLTRDDVYEDYHFPAGTVFVWNAWSLALDEKEYEQPERFWPERFLNHDLDKALKGHWGFGAGRRVCVGWQVGDANVWIAIARLLYCFDIVEVEGHPIDTMNIPQLHWSKEPFKLQIKPRSKQHAELIERDCLEAVNTMY